jgi:hypothetical protein
VGTVSLPGAGELRVEFSAIPETSTLVMMGMTLGIVFLVNAGRARLVHLV